MKRHVALLSLITATSLWGASNVAQKSMFDNLDTFTAMGARCLVATLFLLPFAIAEQRRSRSQAASLSRPRFSTLLWFTAAVMLQQLGAALTTATNLSFLMNLTVVFTPIFVWSLRGTRPPARVWGAALLCLAGTFLLSDADISAFRMGDMLCVASAAAYAFWIISMEDSMKLLNAPATMTIQQFVLPIAIGWSVGFCGKGVSWLSLLRVVAGSARCRCAWQRPWHGSRRAGAITSRCDHECHLLQS